MRLPIFLNHKSIRAEGITKERSWGEMIPLLIFIFLIGGLAASSGSAERSEDSKTIVDLQPFRRTTSIRIQVPGGEEGRATLINLNRNINAWYVLRLSWGDSSPEEIYHLANARPKDQDLILDESNPEGVVILAGKEKHRCDLWAPGSRSALREARRSGVSYAPLCGERIYLRNPSKGHRTRLERVTDFLRDEVPAGEKIVSFVKGTFFKDLYREDARSVEAAKTGRHGRTGEDAEVAPQPALMDPKRTDPPVQPAQLGIETRDSLADGMIPGNWYAVKDSPGVYVGLMVPGSIAPEVLASYRNVVGALDRVEMGAVVYLAAFDLDQFELKFALGTEHPRVDWSHRILERMKDESLPGPDGIGTIAPLVSTGIINPVDAPRTVAAFTGGFKRTHGAFRWGDLSLKNHGSHYGFIENGVVFSKLQPGLATIYTLNDGRTDMKTWSERDNDLLPGIRYARQNGVPIIANFDQASRNSIPGPLVARWGEGNWSGSADEKLRTLRAGAALQETDGKRFLLYAVFTSATPSAMARVFQAYRCRYAMLLDMNALEHTYLAVYKRLGSKLYVQHLIQGMSEVDRSAKGQYIPRFLGYPDNRDFFYLVGKGEP